MSKLTKRQKLVIKRKYDGTYQSTKLLAEEYEVSNTLIRWIVDHKDFRRKMIRHNMKWQKRHPEKFKNYMNRYREKNRKKLRKKAKEYWERKKKKLIA